jgi:thioredoxin
MSNVQHVNKEDWQKIQSDAKPTFVDFWATWCGPCRMIGPTFEKLADQYSKEFNFAKVNVDEEPELAGQFGIRSIPTLLLIKDGKVVEEVIGARPYEELAKVLEAHLAASAKK